MIRTKIIATMGPACGDVESLVRLFEAGVDICRLNFSHGTLDEHLVRLRQIREATVAHGQPIAVLGDLCGPKIRVGEVKDHKGTGGMPVETGDQLIIQREPVLGENGRVCSIYKGLIDDVEVGHRVLIEDGLLRFVCTEKRSDEIVCSCTAGGVIKSKKGINLPNSHVNTPSITDRDWECIDWAIEQGLDYLALSFVRRPDELQRVREHLRHKMSSIQLIAKIEKAEAVQNIAPILDAADGLMIARGDLGVEMDVAQVPILQKELIAKCQSAAKPVIVATQMLQSMIELSSPTRAEVSDVANAIFDGTDAVMLSGETSIGRFPHGAVLVMAHIAEVTEEYLDRTGAMREPGLRLQTMQVSTAMARGVRQMVDELRPRLVVIFSQTGSTARIFSKFRFPVPLVALSSDPRALRRMALHYGVIPQELANPGDMTQLAMDVDRIIQQQGFAQPGERVIIVAGSSLGTPGTMNGVILHTTGEHWTPTVGSDEP